MRRPGVLAAARAVAQEEAVERAADAEPDGSAKARSLSDAGHASALPGGGWWRKSLAGQDVRRSYSISSPRSRLTTHGEVTLGIRPESVKVGDGFGVALRGQVELVERLGHETFIEVLSAGDHAVTALVDGKTLVEMCDSVTIGFDPVECHLFDASGDAFRRLQVPEIANYKRAAE